MTSNVMRYFLLVAVIVLVGAAPKPASMPEGIEIHVVATPVASAPDPGCRGRVDDRRSDLCAQWTAADAARNSAFAAWFSAIVSALTLGAAIWAGRWAKAAAIHNEQAVAVARDARRDMVEAERGRIVVAYEGPGYLGRDGHLTLQLRLANLGRTSVYAHQVLSWYSPSIILPIGDDFKLAQRLDRTVGADETFDFDVILVDFPEAGAFVSGAVFYDTAFSKGNKSFYGFIVRKRPPSDLVVSASNVDVEPVMRLIDWPQDT